MVIARTLSIAFKTQHPKNRGKDKIRKGGSGDETGAGAIQCRETRNENLFWSSRGVTRKKKKKERRTRCKALSKVIDTKESTNSGEERALSHVGSKQLNAAPELCLAQREGSTKWDQRHLSDV